MEERYDNINNSQGKGCLFILFAIFVAIASVFVPLGLMWVFSAKFNLVNYVISALSSGAIMAIVVIIDTVRLKRMERNKPKNDENSNQGN